MGQEIKIRIKPYKTAKIRINPEKSGNPSWDIDLGNFRKLGQDFLNLNFAEKPKNKRKIYKFFTKNKNKKFIFFQKKLGQEIKIRIKPDKTGKIRKSFLGH